VDVEGLDLIFIGPFDLHISLGLMPALWSDQPPFQTAIEKVIAACRRRNLPFGTLTPNADGAAARIADGFTFIGLGTDIIHLLGALRSQREALNQYIKG
jgi:4-hydroxy-2-oxoheptanedioate aldolase